MDYTRVNIIFPKGVPLISTHAVLEVLSDIILVLSFSVSYF